MDFTVLLADASGGRSRREAGEWIPPARIAEALRRLRRATESSGGLVMKVEDGVLMAVFTSPRTAADAALAMHAALEGLPVQVAFHSGPIVQRGDAVLGETVRLAEMLLERAHPGQTLTSQGTAEQLATNIRNMSRALCSFGLYDGRERVRACTLPARPGEAPPEQRGADLALLVCGERRLECSRLNERVVIGRHPGCTLTVADPVASRRHCTVEWTSAGIVLHDHSTNGTYVSIRGEGDVLVRGERLPLRNEGEIGFSRVRLAGSQAVKFFCG